MTAGCAGRGRGYDFSKLAEVSLICNSNLGRPISKNRSPDPSALRLVSHDAMESQSHFAVDHAADSLEQAGRFVVGLTDPFDLFQGCPR